MTFTPMSVCISLSCLFKMNRMGRRWCPEVLKEVMGRTQPSCTDFIYGAATEPATRVQCPPTDWKNRRPLNWMNQCDSVTCRRAPPAGQQSAHGRLPADDEVTRLCQCWPKEAALSCHSAFRPPWSDRLIFPFFNHEQIKITLNELKKSFAY